MRSAYLVKDAIQDVKNMIQNGIPHNDIAENLCPEIPIKFRIAMVNQIRKNLDKSDSEIIQQIVENN